MKKIILIGSFALVLSGCDLFNRNIPEPQSNTSSTPEIVAVSDSEPEPHVYELIVRDNNYGVEELYAQKGEVLIIKLRNQLEEPVNMNIDELSVRSDTAEFGELVEMAVPTDEVGEFEMYSTLGNQREEGFSTLLIIEDNL